MNMTRDRLQSIGWFAVLLICFTMLVALTFRVNAVKSQVRLAERQIVVLKRDKMFLETEFETRANQQQLRNLNDVEFGYQAPTSKQYLEGERQLAALGKPRGPGAPSPIRVASAEDVVQNSRLAAMVSPLTGKSLVAETAQVATGKPLTVANLGDRLSHVERAGVRSE